MADHPNVARCRRAYELFNAGDASSVRELLAEEITWHVPGRGKFAGAKHGREEVLEFLERVGWEQGQTTFEIALRDVVADDRHMVAFVHYHHERGEAVFDQEGVEFFSLDPEGKVTAFWALLQDSAAFDEFFG